MLTTLSEFYLKRNEAGAKGEVGSKEGFRACVHVRVHVHTRLTVGEITAC